MSSLDDHSIGCDKLTSVRSINVGIFLLVVGAVLPITVFSEDGKEAAAIANEIALVYTKSPLAAKAVDPKAVPQIVGTATPSVRPARPNLVLSIGSGLGVGAVLAGIGLWLALKGTMIFNLLLTLAICFLVAGCRPASPPEASSPLEPNVAGVDQELRVDPEPLRREFGKSVTLYSDDFRDRYPTRGQKFQLDRYQLESPVVVWDDSHLRKITVLRTRGDKYGYDQQKCVMTIEGERLPQPRFLSVLGFRLIRTSWITEKLVLIKLDIGHAAGVYAIYDAEQDKLIYCESVHYGLVIEPDGAASQNKPIRSGTNSTPPAAGSSHLP